jgi:hypothetical protein
MNMNYLDLLGANLFWIFSDNFFEFHSLAFVAISEDHMYALQHSYQGNNDFSGLSPSNCFT